MTEHATIADLECRLAVAEAALREKSHVEAALRQSEELCRIAIEGGRLGTWRWNMRDELIWGDAAFLDLWGFPPLDEPRRLPEFVDRMSPQGRTEMNEMVTRAIAVGEEFDGQLAITSGPTEGRWVRWRGRAERERPWLLNGVSFDVTAQRLSDERLRTSEERYRAFVTASADAVYRMSPDWSHMHQLDGRGFLVDTGGPDADWIETYILPEDRPHVLASIGALIRDKRVFELEHRVRRADGGVGWTLSRAVPIFAQDGAVTEWLGAARDVTERKRVEAAHRESEERQAFLLKLSDALRTEGGVEAVGGLAARMIADELGLDRVYFVTANSHNDEVLVTHEVRRADMPPMLGLYHSSDFPSAIKEFLERPIIYADVSTDPRLTELDRRSFAGLSAVGFAAVPIRRGAGTLIWAIGAVSTKPRHWAAGDIVLLEEAAERTWAAIERARTDAALRASEQALAADLAGTSLLRDLAEQLVTEEDPATIHGEILSAAMTITRSDAGTVQVYEPATQALILLVTRGFDHTMTERFHRVRADSKTACGGALREGRRTFDDFDADETDEACRMHVEAGYRSAQATPLLSRTGAPLGMLNTHWRASGHRPSERELRFLDLLARQAADLIERAQAQQQLRESEERLREFGEASSDVLWIRDTETFQWTYLTPAFETIYGVDRETALSGDNMAGWTKLIEPEDRERAVESLRRVRGGERVSFEYRVRRPIDGAVRWLRNTDFPMRDPAGAVRSIGGIGRDITNEKKTADRMGVLVAELQHRTRNLMGVVRSLAAKTLARSADLAEFGERFDDRLAALARVQGLLSRLDEWDRVTFDALIRSELAVLDAEAERVALDGPDGVALRSSTVQTFALALHELMTNALKYGALAQPRGRLDIRWRVERAEGDGRTWLHVDWRESGVTMPANDASPRGGGSGRELIERALPYQLGAKTTYVMAEDGVHCAIVLPVSEQWGARETVDA